MPRPKPGQERRRCAKACDSCKKRKEKCDGLRPCSHCKRRNQESACAFSSNTTRATNPNLTRSRTAPAQLHEDMFDHSDAEVTIESLLDFSHNTNEAAAAPQEGDSPSTISAPVPKLSRMLRDGTGKFNDKANCHLIGWAVQLHYGQPATQSDRDQPDDADGRFGRAQSQPRRRLRAREALFVAASGALDLFDSSWFMKQLPTWVDDPSRSQKPESPIFYLVVAIGAAARAQAPADDFTAEYYFSYGRHQAIANLMDNPSILTVQAFALITWYMATACRRNGASMSLGIAVQAAYALGIHRHEANVAFARDEGIARERAWKTMRVCDLFLSASMGRPPLTSDLECNIPWQSLAQSEAQAGSEIRSQVSSAMLRICFVFERIITEVYSKRAVSLELTASISKLHREWAMELPEMLKIDGLSRSKHQDLADLTRYLGSAIVVMAYYYSIILLTRPFLTFRVCSHIKCSHSRHNSADRSPGVTTYTDACISSAIKGIAMAHEVILYAGMPKRLPLIINSVFISALSLGLAYFGDYDRHGWPLESALTQAIAVLSHFGAHNPLSARYQQIIELLRAAATQYTKRRDDHVLQSSSQLVTEIFGQIPGQTEPRPQLRPTTTTTMPQPHGPDLSSSTIIPGFPTPGTSQLSGHDSWSGLDLPTVQDSESDMLLQSSMITTSGTLAPRLEDSDDRQPQPLTSSEVNNAFFDDMCAPGSISSHSHFSLADEVPLFNIVSDYHYHPHAQHEQAMFDMNGGT